MATNRKLGRTTDIRLSMLKTQVTDLLWHGKIETTETRAKETKAIADSLIALAVKEAGNFEEVEVKVAEGQENTENAEVSTPVNPPKVTSIRVETYGINYGLPETLTPFDYMSWLYKQNGINQKK